VRVVRDRLGVPHLFAEWPQDAYCGLGYVMASDRLWQMDLMRRLGSGRVAEIFGRPFLALDAAAHTLDLPAAAAQAAASVAGEAAEVAAAFAAGINARLTAAPLPPEFELLGYRPGPWRPVDSIAIEYFVGFALGLENLEPKLVLARALGALGVTRGAWLYPCPLPPMLDRERLAAYRALDVALLEAFAPLGPPPAGGSNAWAVGPTRAAGKTPLLAGDPHLLHAAPCPWYLAHLSAPGLEVAGAAYVGGPLVQVGRNRAGAWSVTNLTADDAELVLERLDAEGARWATATGGWEPLALREVDIPVRGEAPFRLVVRATGNGPLLDAIANAAGLAAGHPVALRWKGTAAPGHSLSGWLAMHRSRGLPDVLAAAPAFDGAPFQTNLVYADRDGHIAHLPLGALPRREGAAGQLPALGWRGEGRWEGIASLGAVPWRVDPPEGAVWTANETTGAADRGSGLGQPFGEHPARARRIREALLASAAHTVGDFARLQVDDLDLAASANLPALCQALGAWRPDDPVLARACELLLAWDGRAAADSSAAAFYHVLFFAEWVPLLFPEEVCPGLARRWRIATWGAEAVLRAPRSPWFADPDTKAEALRGCARGAAARLRALAGENPSAWRWGDLHRVRFTHPLSFFPRLATGALAPLAVGGSPFTVNQQRLGRAAPPFGAVVGAGVRMVADLADPDHVYLTLATGQAGDPESPHFADQLNGWLAGELHPLTLDPERLSGVECMLVPDGPA
jgi:penicillin amidase